MQIEPEFESNTKEPYAKYAGARSRKCIDCCWKKGPQSFPKVADKESEAANRCIDCTAAMAKWPVVLGERILPDHVSSLRVADAIDGLFEGVQRLTVTKKSRKNFRPTKMFTTASL